jgi:hypothetical protein
MPETPEAQAQVLQAWTDWFGKLGPALADPGNPASQSKSIGPDGSVSADVGGPTGCIILSADALDAAVELAPGCPVLAGGASVQVVETFEFT